MDVDVNWAPTFIGTFNFFLLYNFKIRLNFIYSGFFYLACLIRIEEKMWVEKNPWKKTKTDKISGGPMKRWVNVTYAIKRK